MNFLRIRYSVDRIGILKGGVKMKVKCLNCGREIDLLRLEHDENNPKGFYTSCIECGVSFDIDFNPVTNTFITDIPKMADFKILTKEEFLRSYSYITEDEYDATVLYFNWLNADDAEP
jgi:DNA-directed RNA polymerase subunit RPC12/RpoP